MKRRRQHNHSQDICQSSVFKLQLLLLTPASLVMDSGPTAKLLSNLAMGLYGYFYLYSSHRPCSSKTSLALLPFSRGILEIIKGSSLHFAHQATFKKSFYLAVNRCFYTLTSSLNYIFIYQYVHATFISRVLTLQESYM